jgi:4-methylaminobutanoate oxidase (formaldehyde-forming)
MIERARVVIIGGGVAGTAIAYHLAGLGWTDTVVIERDQLTSGSTFHSAGLVGQLRSTVTLTKMMMHGAALYPQLAALTGHDPGWHPVGSLRLASTPERVEELRRQAGWAKTFGLPLELVSAKEAASLCQGLFDPSDTLVAAWLPTDGWLNPSDLTMAFAAGARQAGVTVLTQTRVVDITVVRGHVAGVITDKGTIECEVVVNAGGIFAHQIGCMVGVDVPVVPMAHQYAITRPSRPVDADLPTFRDPDRLVYFREEVGGLIVGGYERNPMPWCVDGDVPADFNNRLLAPDWERFLPLSEAASALVPAVADADVVQLVNGPEAFTPDGEFLLGASDLPGFYVAAGFCAHGIAGAAGNGEMLAQWIAGDEPPGDLWRMDPRRFGAPERSRSRALARAYEVYSTYYDITYPFHERAAGRPLRVSAAYARHGELDAVFGEKAGWERVNWYGSNEDPDYERFRPRGWAGHNWSTAIVAEHLAARRAAALFDESSFSKIEVTGPGAASLLQQLCANNVDRAVGAVVYTSLLNSRGGIECDLTVTRLAADRFFLVTGTAFGGHDQAWIARSLPGDGTVTVTDVTSAWGCLAVWGPNARSIVASVCDDDLTFRYMQARPITVADVPCRALRVTYVGEHGWELYAPSELTLHLWDGLLAAGRPHGLVPGGYRAIESLRLEKGYRAWGSDIGPDRDPIAAGLGFAVRDPSLIHPSDERLACLVLDHSDAVAAGNEPVLHAGTVVGRVTSGGRGYFLELSIAYAWLPADLAASGTLVEVEIFGERVGAEVRADPLYDPKGERVR